jgi:hypothetical protein
MSKDGSPFTVYGSPFYSPFVLSYFRLARHSWPAASGQATAGGFVIICFGFWHLSFDIHLKFGL